MKQTIAILLCLALLAGCAASSGPASLPAPLDPNQPDGSLLFYHYLPEIGAYRADRYLLMPEYTTLSDVFHSVAAQTLSEGKLPDINVITIENDSHVVCDLTYHWLNMYSDEELQGFCHSLVMTMIQNGLCTSVGFEIDGEVGLLGEEIWEAAELKLAPDNEDQDDEQKIPD